MGLDNGPTYTYTNTLTEGQKPVEVGVTNLTEYAGHVFKIYMNSMGSTAKAFAHIPTLLTKGLNTPVDDVAPLAEGQMAEQMMRQRIADFQAFLGEMNTGVMAIANAAQVVAYCFDDTDGENGATIRNIEFAFADDGSHQPGGFDNRLLLDGGTTMEQQQEAAAAAAGANAGSYAGLYGDTSSASENRQGNRWTWPDGSYMTATRSTELIRMDRMTIYVTTYTVHDKDGKVVGTRVQRSYSDPYSGSDTESTEITSGETTQRTSVTTHSDGHVSTSTTTTAPGADGEQHTTTTSNETRPEDHSGDTGEQGPVETATDMYDTDGTQRGQQQYGMGY